MFIKVKKVKNLNFWTSFFCLLSVLIITGSVLTYQHQASLKTRSQELQEKRKQIQQQYNLQETHLVSITELVNNPKVHSFFTDLLNTYAQRFAKSKNLVISPLPLKFAGFHVDDRKIHRKMGVCWIEQKTAKISLNRLYLLNKLGHDKYFVSDSQADGGYVYSFIGFAEMSCTCAHELAHYFQFVKHGKSSCRSDLILKNGRYDKELASEHEKFTEEIHKMIKNSRYSELEKTWKKT